MTHLDDYNTLLPVLREIPKEEVWQPRMPVDIAAQEGGKLYDWSVEDKEILVSHGLDGTLIDSLPTRVGALIKAESSLIVTRDQQREARKTWVAESEEAMELRYTLLRIFRFAFKNNPVARSQLTKVNEGGRQSDYVVDLDRLADLGEHYTAELEAIHFDTGLIDKARQLAKQMGDALSVYQNAALHTPGVDIRNRAYTYLQMAVVEIRSFGKFAFHDNPDRLEGYFSHYKPPTRTDDSDEERDDAEPMMPDTDMGS